MGTAWKYFTDEERREASAARQRAWRKSLTPEQRKQFNRRSALRRLYGITIEEYDLWWEAQGGVCAICAQPEFRKGKDGTVHSLHVDHDHDTGVIRGLLCTKCNVLLGLAKDDPQLLEDARTYLWAVA